jgi:CubicO group peptidase (beta-lactamase class C family)
MVPELMGEFRVPGASLACVRRGQLVWSRCFGMADVNSRRAVDEETLFEAASVSKTVFAYAALKLCEQGVIGLDAPLVRYARESFVDDPRIERITPRQLLSHSSGLAEWRSRNVPMIASEPGTRFQYSGEGYFYLQSALTELLGKTDSSLCATYEADFKVCATDFDSFMKKRLLRPFGMGAQQLLARSRSTCPSSR